MKHPPCPSCYLRSGEGQWPHLAQKIICHHQGMRQMQQSQLPRPPPCLPVLTPAEILPRDLLLGPPRFQPPAFVFLSTAVPSIYGGTWQLWAMTYLLGELEASEQVGAIAADVPSGLSCHTGALQPHCAWMLPTASKGTRASLL